ncbi:MAG: hypothetical protein HZA12_03510 [Nitrospirae bacterium]|nr:hypothetical protein [Nitrospirota bacterium]
MDDIAHIGFINAHAKGNGRHDDLHIVPDKTLLIFIPHFGSQSCMVRESAIAIRLKACRQTVGSLSALAIDNP